jgi:nitrogen fixation NifU-like protein
MYSEKIIERYKSPRYLGNLDGFTHIAKETNASCGDEIEVFLKVEEGVVKEVRYTGMGCSIALGGMDLLLDEVIGKSVEEIKGIDELAIIGMEKDSLRIKCGSIGKEALIKALSAVE